MLAQAKLSNRAECYFSPGKSGHATADQTLFGNVRSMIVSALWKPADSYITTGVTVATNLPDSKLSIQEKVIGLAHRGRTAAVACSQCDVWMGVGLFLGNYQPYCYPDVLSCWGLETAV